MLCELRRSSRWHGFPAYQVHITYSVTDTRVRTIFASTDLLHSQSVQDRPLPRLPLYVLQLPDPIEVRFNAPRELKPRALRQIALDDLVVVLRALQPALAQADEVRAVEDRVCAADVQPVAVRDVDPDSRVERRTGDLDVRRELPALVMPIQRT